MGLYNVCNLSMRAKCLIAGYIIKLNNLTLMVNNIFVKKSFIPKCSIQVSLIDLMDDKFQLRPILIIIMFIPLL